MSKVQVITTDPSNLFLIKSTINPIAEVQSIKPANLISAKNVNYVARIDIIEHLPFRIRFLGIGVNTYDTTNAPPIGTAIIGYSNYIL
jgi:hypothetical protein